MFNAIDVLTNEFNQQPLEKLWSYISPMYMVDESAWLEKLLPLSTSCEQEKKSIEKQTIELITSIRKDKKSVQMIDALLLEYSLDTQEGILLMCLAEALMRIPDAATADALIRDKLTVADWKAHLKKSDSVFVNASTWGLMFTGKVVGLKGDKEPTPVQGLNRLVNKMSEPVIRNAMNQAMKIMGHQFVLGRNIAEAQKNGLAMREKGYTYSYDMLGEAALTAHDATKYFNDYMLAIEAVGLSQLNSKLSTKTSVSIKLSALHPRYEVAQKGRVMRELYRRVEDLIRRARSLDIALTIDAEEADRLELSLELFEKLYQSSASKGWGGFGLVIQAYSKRALPILAWLNRLATEQGDCIPLRLVKGAYWDSEIKWSQQGGYVNYPVFTRKEATDVSYLACARYLLSDQVHGHIYPQFASHNAHTVTAIANMAKHRDYEFQRLHGMGDALYEHAMAKFGQNVRIYAPVGSHKDLLPYLVRRLLENGANSSFVHRLVDASCPIELLNQHPVDSLLEKSSFNNPHIRLPPNIFDSRKNSHGVNVDIDSESSPFQDEIDTFLQHTWHASSVINGRLTSESMIKEDQRSHSIYAPYDRSVLVGEVFDANEEIVNEAIEQAHYHQISWQSVEPQKRAEYLQNFADLLEINLAELVALCHKEAGKTIHDSIDEVREAVDFCRYYASQSHLFEKQSVNSPFGDEFIHQHKGLGVFACISPWNFPLAIFLGQISAALMAGNTVVAKPAEQTSLIAMKAHQLILEAGFPSTCIQLLLGEGAKIGQMLTSDPRITGVAFTGSTPTAQRIAQNLAQRESEPAVLIAETGGQNAMIVDSTALPEQVVRDVLRSAFASAGQRCSALRVLYVQEDISQRIIELIQGAMEELSVGLPYLHSTDVGPVIDKAAKDKLMEHFNQMTLKHKLISQVSLPEICDKGDFIAPAAIEINHIQELTEEKFGPILHIIKYKASDLPKVVADINKTGFGLTLGVHSRNEMTYEWIEKHARVGNSYINRDQVGAVVGVQPFGGQGLSGTGPKAGGPHYLYRFSKLNISSPDRHPQEQQTVSSTVVEE